MINQNSKIFLAGHKGMVGSAILNKLKEKKYKKIFTVDKKKIDLTEQSKVFKHLNKIKPDLVIIAAARVGGIMENEKYKSKFIYENLQIQNNLIHGSYLAKVKKLIFLGSSCIYPKNSKQPIKEKYILSGPLEETNDAYSIAKIAGIKMCNFYSANYKVDYKCLMPSNMYGPNDNYNLNSSHFFAALIKKVLIAKKKGHKSLVVWGSGKPRRELLFVNDLADAVLYFANKKFSNYFVNIGLGKDHSIKWYANFLKRELGANNLKIKFDKSKPDGMPRKLLDISEAQKLGWNAKTSLKDGLKITIRHYLSN